MDLKWVVLGFLTGVEEFEEEMDETSIAGGSEDAEQVQSITNFIQHLSTVDQDTDFEEDREISIAGGSQDPGLVQNIRNFIRNMSTDHHSTVSEEPDRATPFFSRHSNVNERFVPSSLNDLRRPQGVVMLGIRGGDFGVGISLQLLSLTCARSYLNPKFRNEPEYIDIVAVFFYTPASTNPPLRTIEFIKKLRWVRHLKLSKDALIHTYKEMCVFCHCLTKLEIVETLTHDDLLPLILCLRKTPLLEHFQMNEGIGRSEDNSDSHTDSLFLHEQVPYCLERSLKMVRMNHFYGKSAEVDMVRNLLKNSQVLLVCGHKPSSMEFIELIAKLAKCPRLSTNCELDLVYQLED